MLNNIENMQKILEIADQLVFNKTGKHLDNLQVSILKGVWENQHYTEIAEEYHCSEGHVKDVSYELWQILSELFGETVRKSNLRAVFERNINNFAARDIVHIGDNFCGSPSQLPKKDKYTTSVLKLHQLGLSIEKIADILSLSIEDVQKIIVITQPIT